jgi:SAM-dependent methyltransferase
MKKITKHLDLGCGHKPKNPYEADQLYGLDIEKISLKDINKENIVEIKMADLSLDKIPYNSNYFDSVSAYDFLEHIPRTGQKIKNNTILSKYPFIDCMNEIYRVLKHGGKFYAVTPIYPNESAFVDPTHVNIITYKTYTYFCLPSLGADIYGFYGKFEIIRIKKIRPKYLYEPVNPSFRQVLRKLNDKARKLESHILWELKANKL